MDMRYFSDLCKAVTVEFEVRKNPISRQQEKIVKKIYVQNFIVRVNFVDRMLSSYKLPILELSLNGTLITANECLILSENSRAS